MSHIFAFDIIEQLYAVAVAATAASQGSPVQYAYSILCTRIAAMDSMINLFFCEDLLCGENFFHLGSVCVCPIDIGCFRSSFGASWDYVSKTI